MQGADPRISSDAVAERLAALDAVSRLLTRAEFDLPRLLREIVRATAEHMQVRACALRLVDVKTGTLVLEAAHGFSPEFVASAPGLTREGEVWELLDAGEHVEILDVGERSVLYPADAGRVEGVRSMLVGGMFRKGRLVGTLSVFTEEEHTFTELERHVLRIFAAQAALAIELAQLHKESLEHQRLKQELLQAADVQARMLPDQVPDVPGVRIAAWGRSWHEVGGDFYDFLELPGSGLGLAIGDVCGKGLPAALLMAAVRTALRSQAENLHWLPEAFRRINHTLYRSSRPEQFSTLFFGIFDPSARTLSYVNAGHNPPLLIRGRRTRRLEAGGVPIGLLPEATYETAIVGLQTGDLLVLYTDGFTDVVCDGDRVFGEERLCRVLLAHAAAPPEAVIEAVNDALEEAGCGGDDRTMVVVRLV